MFVQEGKSSQHIADEGRPGLVRSIGECSDNPTINNLQGRCNGQALTLILRQIPVLTSGYITNRQTQRCGNVGKTLAIFPRSSQDFTSSIISLKWN